MMILVHNLQRQKIGSEDDEDVILIHCAETRQREKDAWERCGELCRKSIRHDNIVNVTMEMKDGLNNGHISNAEEIKMAPGYSTIGEK